jgi:predicted permease
MMVAIEALLPILLVTALGWVIARLQVVSEQGWAGIETIAYQVLFPSIVILNVAQADFSALPAATLGVALFSAVVTMSVICLVLRPFVAEFLRLDGARFTSVLQGATRWNTFIALAMAANLYGVEGVALTAVAIVAMTPVLNLINVAALSWFAAGTRPSPRRFSLDLAGNPFIWSSAAGIVLNLLGVDLPQPIAGALGMLGAAALAIGILAVGAGLDLSALRRPGPALTTATLLRLIGMPLLAALFCSLFGVTGAARGVALVAAAVPTAGGAYLLARRMGGDARLMAEIITLQTVAAALTLPLAIGLLS